MILVAVAVSALTSVQASALTIRTADERLVASIETARAGGRAAAGSLVDPPAAAEHLRRAVVAMAAARTAAPHAVAALDTPSVRAALRHVGRLAHEARVALRADRLNAARAKVGRAVELSSRALEDFGAPLEKEFPSFAISRDFDYLPEFAAYSGVSATVGDRVTEIVIGPADRATANLGEPGASPAQSDGLPITQLSVAVFSDSIGRFSSGWCDLESGLITCRMKPAMPADRIFTIAFGPKLDRGTKLLVKFRAADGDRSYSVLKTR